MTDRGDPDAGLKATLAALAAARKAEDPGTLLSTPEMVVSISRSITAAERRHIEQAMLGDDNPRWLIGVDIHVAVRLPDGSWYRACHDESVSHETYVPAPEEVDGLLARISATGYAGEAVEVVESWIEEKWGVKSTLPKGRGQDV